MKDEFFNSLETKNKLFKNLLMKKKSFGKVRDQNNILLFILMG